MSSELSQIKAVIFDMDGLLVDSEKIYREAWLVAFREQGLHLNNEFYEKNFVGRRNSECEKIVQDHFGNAFSLSDFRKTWPGIWQSIVDKKGIPLRPGVKEIMVFVEERGLRRALASSSTQEYIDLTIGPHGLKSWFEVVVGGDEVTHGKPAPDIFIKAASKLGVEPEDCIVLEDSEAGIRGASSAGMFSIFVPSEYPPTEKVRELATTVCESLNEVADFLSVNAENSVRVRSL